MQDEWGFEDAKCPKKVWETFFNAAPNG